LAGPDNVHLTVSIVVNSFFTSIILSIPLLPSSKPIHPCMQMLVRRATKRKNNLPSSSDTSSGGGDEFIVSPRACRLMMHTSKTPHGSGVGSSSQHAVQQEEEESSDAI
jgi:hypothetical protein